MFNFLLLLLIFQKREKLLEYWIASIRRTIEKFLHSIFSVLRHMTVSRYYRCVVLWLSWRSSEDLRLDQVVRHSPGPTVANSS